VADPEACARAHAAVAEVLGPIAVLVSCAGINAQRIEPLHEQPFDLFQRMIAVHVHGSARMAALCVPAMRSQRFGRIVHICLGRMFSMTARFCGRSRVWPLRWRISPVVWPLLRRSLRQRRVRPMLTPMPMSPKAATTPIPTVAEFRLRGRLLTMAPGGRPPGALCFGTGITSEGGVT